MYITMASFSYCFIFDRSLMQHPKFLKNQIRLEIKYTCSIILFRTLPTVLLFLLHRSSWLQQALLWGAGCVWLADCVIQCIHFSDVHWWYDLLDTPWPTQSTCLLTHVQLHKPHHKWKIPLPFASHVFHPIDDFLQSLPYHVYPFLFPLTRSYILCYLSLSTCGLYRSTMVTTVFPTS